MSIGSGSNANANADIALIRLPEWVFEDADSRRPMIWNGWASPDVTGQGLRYNDSNARFGIAGYSPFAGAWECPDLEPGPTDVEHDTWRQHGEGFTQGNFYLSSNDDTLTWNTDNSTKGNQGDSGGPLYVMQGAARRVIAVRSKSTCKFNVGFDYVRSELFTNVTRGAPAGFVDSHASDGRSSSWLLRHGSLSSHWAGEVDYLGPCTTPYGHESYATPAPPGSPSTQDLDCDHWYDSHDDCPLDYNPGQEEDASGKGIACKNRAPTPSYDPANPTTTHIVTTLDYCPESDGVCEVGLCGIGEIAGQFWQRPTSGGAVLPYTHPDWRGSYARMQQGPTNHYQVVLHETPDEVNNTHYAVPDLVPSCVPLSKIESIPDPDACYLKSGKLSGGAPTTGQKALYADDAGGTNVLFGLIGNVGFPAIGGFPTPGNFVLVTNSAKPETPGDPTFIKQRRDLSSDRGGERGVTAEAMTLICPGWIHKYYVVDKAVTSADSSPRTEILVDGIDAPNAHCFITGLEGPWGGYSATQRMPRARIWSDPASKTIFMTVMPSMLTTPRSAVTAHAMCLDLRP